jgi:putative glutamine amidotransferase
MPPLIGISQCLDERGRWRRGREYLYVDFAYVRAVERAGGYPLLLPIQHDAAALVERIDALILPGGDDFLPDADYPHPVHFDPVAPRQHDFDAALLRAALTRHVPVLGICYGAQLLALDHGGSLHHHIPVDLPMADDHQLPEQDGRHPVEIVPGSRLASAIGAGPVDVNSLHHQAIDEPGRGLRVAARAKDGVVEAIERTADAFCIGVQWHPEKLAGKAGDGLFSALVAACGQQ